MNMVSVYTSSENFNEFELSIKLQNNYKEEYDFIIRYFQNKINCKLKNINELYENGVEYTFIIKKEYKYILNHISRFCRYLNDYRTYTYIKVKKGEFKKIEFNSIEKSNNVMEILNYIDTITEIKK